MLRQIFNAKRVPLEFMDYLVKYKDSQRQDWNNVVDTLTGTLSDVPKEFNYYFDFVCEIVKELRTP